MSEPVRSRLGPRMLVLVLVTGVAAQGLIGAAQGMSVTATVDSTATPSDSIAELRRRVTLAGEPTAVLWAAERLGPGNLDSFPPGPTDTRLRAVLTYRSAGELAALLHGGPTEPVDYAAPAWFPASLNPGGTIAAIRHHGVQGFMDAAVMTTLAAPGLLILDRPTS